jgi:hypothetical protein
VQDLIRPAMKHFDDVFSLPRVWRVEDDVGLWQIVDFVVDIFCALDWDDRSLNAFHRFQAVIRCGTGLQVHIFLDNAAKPEYLQMLSSSSCSLRLVTDCL